MKKFIAAFLASAILTSTLPVISFAKSILCIENFDKYEIGETNVSNRAFKTGGTAGTEFKVAYPPKSSNKCLKISNDGTGRESGTSANIYLQIDSKEDVTIEARIMPTDLSTITKIGLESPVNVGYPPLAMIFNDGNIHIYTGVDNTVVSKYSKPYDLNEWLDFKFVIHTMEETYDYYLNGYKEATNIALPGRKGMFNEYGFSQCIINRGCWENVKSTIYVDDVKVTLGNADSEIDPPVWNEESSGLELRFNPRDKMTCQQNPPFFKWPAFWQGKSYEVQLSRKADMSVIDYDIKDIKKNFCTLDHTLDTGVWYWRVKGESINGQSAWSDIRRFRIKEDAWEFPVPSTEKLKTMVRKDHPRIWVNNDSLEEYRKIKDGAAKDFYEEIKKRVDEKMENPLPPEPILTFPPNATEDEKNVARVNLRADSDGKVNEMFESAYIYILTGDEKYGRKAADFLKAIAAWDIYGFTNYSVQDQVHRAIAYKGAITYDWIYSFLTEKERADILEMIRIRTKIMFDSLLKAYPLGEVPYDSHGWSAAEFMLIISLATMHDLPAADEWFEEIAPLSIGVAPVWGGEDGGHAEGTAYGSFASSMFLAVVEDSFNSATGFKMWNRAFDRNEHIFYMYFSPNGAPFGAFGDESYTVTCRDTTVVNAQMSAAVRYNDTAAKWASETRGALPYTGEISYYHYFTDKVEAIPPFNYLTSRIDNDIGWVAMHSDLIDPMRKEILFKSGFYGSYNHSHADQNSFIIAAYGEPLATDNGYYDYYFSQHDKRYTKTTIAHNAITYDKSKGQYFNPRDGAGNINSKGEISGYLHGDVFNLASGDATSAYSEGLSKAVRHMIYLKPDFAIVVDELKANDAKPTQFEFNLHSLEAFKVDEDTNSATVVKGRAKLVASCKYPQLSEIEQMDKFYDINGEEVRPGTRHSDKRNQYTVRFDTEKLPETVMVTTMDILKKDDAEKNIVTEKNDDCMVITVNGKEKIYVRLNQNKEEITYNGITFKGSAAVFSDNNYMLVNGTKLEKDGVTLIDAKNTGNYSFEGGEVHVNSSDDALVKFNLPYEVMSIKDENGKEIKEFGTSGYDYNTMPYKWTKNKNELTVDFEKGSYNIYFNGTAPIKYNGTTVRINGTPVSYTSPVVFENGSLYVPLFETSKAYGAEVTNSGTEYRIVKGNNNISIYPGYSTAKINGENKTLGGEAKNINGVLYVPFRGYFGLFTNRIGWSEYASTAYVYTEPMYHDDMSSSVWPRTDIMSEEEQAEYQKKK